VKRGNIAYSVTILLNTQPVKTKLEKMKKGLGIAFSCGITQSVEIMKTFLTLRRLTHGNRLSEAVVETIS